MTTTRDEIATFVLQNMAFVLLGYLVAHAMGPVW